jgi:pimeloyl-ACP methyl ester carboxylesterase
MLFRFVLIAVAILLTLLVLVILGQRRLLYPVRYVNKLKPSETSTRKILYRVTEGLRIEAWLLLPERMPPRGLIVHAHGNGEILDQIESEYLHYSAKHGYAVLMPEYRGYSRSEGSPAKDEILGDFEYFLDEVLKLYPHLTNATIYHGRSLGGGVVSELAKRRPPRGLILESTFSSVSDVAHEKFFLPRSWIWDDYSPSSLLREFPAPVLVIHGRQDNVIGFSHAQRNFESAKDGTLLAVDGTHSDTISLNLDECLAAISDFLKKVESKPAQ